jgi:hypothetical protein
MTWNDRIIFDPAAMSGKPCIRGMRVTVGTGRTKFPELPAGLNVLEHGRDARHRVGRQRIS